MHVLVLTPYMYGTAPGPRSSIELWETALAPADIHLHYCPFEDEQLHDAIYAAGQLGSKARLLIAAYARRFSHMRRVRDYDAVLVYREAALVGPEVFERWVRHLGVPIIYQLDDPLYVPYRSPSSGYFSYLKFFGKVGRIAQMAAMTIVNSRHHLEYVTRFTPRTRLIPILVDGDKYVPPKRTPEETVRIGWSGSPTTSGNLNLIASSLAAVSRRPEVDLRLIGGQRYELPGVRFNAVRWTAESEVEELSKLDVGLLPVPETEWTKRKFFMKLIQYMALGIPPICTPLGANTEVVQDGVNGLFARTTGDWDRRLRELIEDRDLRLRVGELAAETAHARYTIQARGADVVEAFRAVLR